jgi:hypothetical protein
MLVYQMVTGSPQNKHPKTDQVSQRLHVLQWMAASRLTVGTTRPRPTCQTATKMSVSFLPSSLIQYYNMIYNIVNYRILKIVYWSTIQYPGYLGSFCCLAQVPVFLGRLWDELCQLATIKSFGWYLFCFPPCWILFEHYRLHVQNNLFSR